MASMNQQPMTAANDLGVTGTNGAQSLLQKMLEEKKRKQQLANGQNPFEIISPAANALLGVNMNG